MSRKIVQEEGLIRPTKRSKDPHLGTDALMVMIPSDLHFLAEMRNAKRVPLLGISPYDLYQYQPRTGAGYAAITLTGPFLGAPQAVMAMEKIIALGVERIWVLGWCGSLQPRLRIGDLLIPTNAISEEGTSNHYPIRQGKPKTDATLNKLLQEALTEKQQSFLKGTVWTTDAPYRETPSKVRRYQEKGVLAVEMEMSALMTVALYRNVKLAGLLVVSDELFDFKWHSGFRDPRLKETSRLAGSLLLRMVESLGK